MMDALRLMVVVVVLGNLSVMSPIAAAPVDTPLATQGEPSASADASQDVSTAESGAPAEVTPGTIAPSVPKSDSTAEKPSDREEQNAPEASSGRVPPIAPAQKSDGAHPGIHKALHLSFLVSSIYNFRGLNVFKETSQADQHALFSPTVTGTFFHPGLWISYAGFFQINGDNRGYLVDSGVGAEQNIAVGYDYAFSDRLTLSTSFSYYFYPFALSRITGVTWPSYLEPAVGIHYRTGGDIRLGLDVSYLAPIQERLRDERYMYTHLSVGKAFQFHPVLALDLDFSLGYKLFADPSTLQDTMFDLEFCVSLPVTLSDGLSLVPGTHAAWGYFVDTRFGDQYMVYFSLDLIADF